MKNLEAEVIYEDDCKLTIHNADGDWSIAKACLNSTYWGQAGLTTGPGYIYKLRLEDGTVIVDDEAKPIQDSRGVDTWGGLGQFAYHHARAPNPPNYWHFNPAVNIDTWVVAGRICAGDYPDPGPAEERNFGVVHPPFGTCCRIVEATWLPDRDWYYLRYVIEVDLRTPWHSRILTVRYEYEFRRSVINLWTRVWTRCEPGGCGDAHFLKEPKFTTEVAVNRYTSARVYTQDREDGNARWDGSCPPWQSGCSRHSHVDDRYRAQYVDTGPSRLPNLNIVARSASPSGRTDYDWEYRDPQDRDRPGFGLDRWAALARNYWPAHVTDGPGGTGQQPWNCHGAGTPFAEIVRRWELVGYRGNPPFPFSIYFHGWEGGSGPNDCEMLSRRFPRGPETDFSLCFSNHFRYSVAAGWETVPPTGSESPSACT